MKLKVHSPVGMVLDTDIAQIDMQALDGAITLKPHHVDYVAALPPNIVSFETMDGATHFMACNRGVVVKQGHTVNMSVQKAILNDDLDTLSKAIAVEFQKDEEERRQVNTAMARLEVGLSRGFMQLKGDNV